MNNNVSSDESIVSESDDNSTELNAVCTKRGSKKMELREAISSVDERSMYVTINKFLKNMCTCDQIEKMIKIINKEDRISLRLLNWFSMKYSASMEGIEFVGENGKLEIFHVKISYKARLKAYSKKYFDPFRRGKRFDYCYGENKSIETTLCQLNFFKWLFSFKLIEYVENNYDILVKKMATYEKKKKEIKIKKKEKATTILNEKNYVTKIKKTIDESNVKLVLTF